MRFKVTYRLTDDTMGEGVVTGPKEATVERCRKVIHLVGPNYSILPLSVSIRPILTKRTTHGFLHELYSRLPDGREAQVTGWYF